MRRGAPSTIHDMVFASAINKSIVQAEQAFEAYATLHVGDGAPMCWNLGV
jgi:hypothetical protein